MKIDCFTHVAPDSYNKEFAKRAPTDYHFGVVGEQIPELVDMDARIAIMEKTGVDKQVLTLVTPPVEDVIQDPAGAHALAAVGNDAIAEIANSYGGRFIGVGNFAQNNIPQSVKEAERCINELGLKGMLMYTSVLGGPVNGEDFYPIFEVMQDLDLPIWLHPARGPDFADYKNETTSRYLIWQMFGWPYETTVTMTRMIFSGVLDRFPKLKIITHHAGAMVPSFDKRIEYVYPLFDKMGLATKDLANLKKPILDYYRMFYNDCALMGSMGGMQAAHAFFGTEHLLYGTDSPLDTFGGELFAKETIASIDALDISSAERDQIYAGNLLSLLGME